MCMNLRGMTYYLSSLHISVSLLFLGGFFVDLVGISEVWHNPYATYFSLILAFLYICLFLVFGLLIFRGVELESAKLLKGAIAGFLVLQLSAFLVYLALLALTNTRKTAEMKRRVEDRLDKWNNNNNSSSNINYTQMSESLLDDDILLNDIPIITLLQIISLVFGIMATIGYVCVVVMYVRSVSPSRAARN